MPLAAKIIRDQVRTFTGDLTTGSRSRGIRGGRVRTCLRTRVIYLYEMLKLSTRFVGERRRVSETGKELTSCFGGQEISLRRASSEP